MWCLLAIYNIWNVVKRLLNIYKINIEKEREKINNGNRRVHYICIFFDDVMWDDFCDFYMMWVEWCCSTCAV